MILEWQPLAGNARGYLSTCRNYSVCSITTKAGKTWEAWRMVPGGPWFAPLKMGLATEDEAKLVAQADADAKAQP